MIFNVIKINRERKHSSKIYSFPNYIKEENGKKTIRYTNVRKVQKIAKNVANQLPIQ